MSSRRSLWLPLLTLALLVRTTPLRAAEEPPAEVAHIRLSGSMDEAPAAPDPLFGGGGETFKIKLDRLKKVQKDANVKALYLECDGLTIGWAKLDELTRAIHEVRKSGKKVYAYLEDGSARDYLLALACDEVCAPESGWIMLTGMRMEISFYKDLFEKIGVQADFLQMGDFKGAAEPYIRSSLSEPNRKQLSGLLDDNYEKGMIERIVKGRAAKKFTAAQVSKLIDEGPYTARAALKAGLIDRVDYADNYQAEIKKGMGGKEAKFVKNYGAKKAARIDFSDPFAFLKLLAGSAGVTSSSREPKIAVIYATGIITTGKSGQSLLGGDVCGSTTIIEAIRQAENDKTVKAIILRVDSPGGSALASDLMWNELRKCKKPVVASMSDVAASGGYYISMGTKRIFAEPGTLTGSIGVVGGKLALGKMWEKVGIKTEVLSRGANSGIMSTNAKFTDSEREAFRSMMKDVYDQFLDKALQGRKAAGKEMTRAQLENLAGGRVWTGRQALANGLVDELGGLDAAIAYVRKEAKMAEDKEPELLLLPKAKGFLDSLLDSRSDSRVGLDLSKVPLLRELPELTQKLRSVEAMLRLRREPVMALLPFHLEVK
jgi:protease-4